MSSFRRTLLLGSLGLLGASSLALVGACAPSDVDDLFADGGGQGGSNTGGAGPSTSSSASTSSGPSTTATTTSSTTTTTSGTGGAPPGCGDGQVSDDEECDGSDLDGADCKDYGYSEDTPGAPVCTNQCTLDASGCLPTCGDGKLEPGEQCDDGNTTSGDGCSATCTLEATGCAVASPVALSLGAPTIINDTNAGGQNDFASTKAPCTGAAGPSKVYAVTPASNGFLTAWLDGDLTTFDSVLYVRTSCLNDVATVLCSDRSVVNSPLPVITGGGEVVSMPVVAGTTYYVVVDGALAGSVGTYRLGLDLSTGQGTCGTNTLDPVPLPVWSNSVITMLGSTEGLMGNHSSSCGGQSAPDVAYRVERKSSSITSMNFALSSALTNFDSILSARLGTQQNGNCSVQSGSNLGCDDEDSNMGGEVLDLVFEQNNFRFVFVDGYMGAAGRYGLVVTTTP